MRSHRPVIWIDEQRHTREGGKGLLEQLQPFRADVDQRKSGDVTARAGVSKMIDLNIFPPPAMMFCRWQIVSN